MKKVLSVVVLAGLLAGCSDGTATIATGCDASLTYAVAVDVRDAQTGRPAGAGGVLYGAHKIGSTTYVDTSRAVTADGSTIYAGSLPGTYDLRLEVPTYAPWIDSGVVVHPAAPDGACGRSALVRLQATLQPAT